MNTSPRVLVADDQADIVVALRLLLRDAGLDVDAASSVSEIRSRLLQADYDLLLMDLNYRRDTTSGREGLELLAEVHAQDPLLPIVVMTGWGSIDTAVEAMRRGARSFVTKPWDNAALADAIRHEVQEGRASRAAGRRMQREQEDAQAIQRGLLPEVPALSGCDIAASWQPASAFGGDYYDIIRIDHTRVAIAVADVCGKGLPAALLMANLQAWTRASVAIDPSPREVAARLNRELTRHAGPRRFVTCFYALFDTASGSLDFTNAGHPAAAVVAPDGSITRLSAGGMVLGAFEEATFEQGHAMLDRGARLLVFTDGITEAMRAVDEEFGDARLEAALRARKADSSPIVAEAILAEVRCFAGGPLQDDATLLVLTRTSQVADACALANKAVPRTNTASPAAPHSGE